MRKSPNLSDGKKGAALAVTVIPRAQHNEIVELARDGSIQLRLRSPADDDSLNENLVAYLAEVLSVDRSLIEIVGGRRGRNKLVTVLGISSQAAHDRIVNLM